MELRARLESNTALHVALCAGGIMSSLILYSVLQERIMTVPFGESQERYTSSLFLVLCNRLLSTMTAFVLLVVYKQEIKPSAPAYNYAAVSISNVVATTCQYEALKYVSFPVQTLGKCAKMIPVMVWGTIIMRRSYKPVDYTLAALVTLGSTAFLMSGELTAKQAKSSSSSSSWGIALMLGYLGFDGFTSTFQDKLFKSRKMSVWNQMLYTNTFSAAFALTGLVFAGQLWSTVAFQSRHPDAFGQILLLSLSATVGQLFIIYTIKQFGALLFATVMTTRQFVSILISCAVFLHPLSLGQWSGTVMVFGALYYKTLANKKKSLVKDASSDRSEPVLPVTNANNTEQDLGPIDVEKQSLISSSPRSATIA